MEFVTDIMAALSGLHYPDHANSKFIYCYCDTTFNYLLVGPRKWQSI